MSKELTNRSFEKIECPHCKKEIMIGIDYKLPHVGSIKTKEESIAIKTKIKVRLGEISFSSPDDLNEVLEWIDREEIIFGEEDIEPLLKQVAIEQHQKISDKL